MPSSRNSRSNRPSDSRRSDSRSSSRSRQTDSRNTRNTNNSRQSAYSRSAENTRRSDRSNDYGARQSRPSQTERRSSSRTSRRAPRSIDRERARINRLTFIIVAFIIVAVIIVVAIGIKSASTTAKANGNSILSASATATPEPTATPAPTQTPKPAAAQEKDISNATVTQYDSLLTVDGTAYEYYKFSGDNATATISAINSMATSLNVNTYAMMIPSGIDIMLPLSLLDELADVTSDQQKAESYILTSLDSSVKTIATYDQLKAYCDQDLYFNTDNHISGLCGYYIYQQWAAAKGVSAVSLSSCSETSYSGFYGNISNSTGLSLDEDTVTVYDPGTSFSYNYMDDYGTTQDGTVFVDVTDYAATQKYQAFLDGVHTRSQITNNSATDDSSCVLVIDSNGTSIAPFIATHYKNTYIVDYRYSYETDNLSKIVSDTGATDVIFCLSMGVTGTGDLASGLTTLCSTSSN